MIFGRNVGHPFSNGYIFFYKGSHKTIKLIFMVGSEIGIKHRLSFFSLFGLSEGRYPILLSWLKIKFDAGANNVSVVL